MTSTLLPRRRLLLAGAGLVGLALAGCGERSAAPPGASTQALFDTTLTDLQGQAQPLSQWRGQPMLVNFWATWCAPCVKEMPDLDALHREFEGVAFVGIGVDSTDNMTEFLRKVPVGYHLLEGRAQGLELMRTLGSSTGGLPFTVIIGADGRIMRAVAGQITPEGLRPTLQQVAG